MKKDKAIKALLTAILLIPISSSVAWANQSPTPSMKDQMKAMNGGSKATTIASSSPAPMGGTYFSVAIPTKVLSAKLFDVNGKTISLNDFKGKYVVVAPFLTSCQEICPMTSVNMRSVATQVAAAKLSSQVVVLEVSVDPYRDSAARLRSACLFSRCKGGQPVDDRKGIAGIEIGTAERIHFKQSQLASAFAHIENIRSRGCGKLGGD